MAKDIYHESVKQALIKDGWKITHDPYALTINIVGKDLSIDYGAERIIAAEKVGGGEIEKIAIEVKSFVGHSLSHDFHVAVGQYINYRVGLRIQEKGRVLYLAVPEKTYREIQNIFIFSESLRENNIYLLLFDPETSIVTSWVK